MTTTGTEEGEARRALYTNTIGQGMPTREEHRFLPRLAGRAPGRQTRRSTRNRLVWALGTDPRSESFWMWR
jgi:hypothetical protein